MIALLFASRSISDFFVGVTAGSRLYCKSSRSMEFAAVGDLHLYTSGTSRLGTFLRTLIRWCWVVETTCLASAAPK